MTDQRVLVVEDEAAIADNIVYALQTEGFRVDTVTTGQAALAQMRQAQPDLLVLDIGLPDTTGFDLCREIRKHSEVPIIFLTARGSEIDRVVGLELGADDYVVKPFSPRELAARVKARLRRSRAPEPLANATGFHIDDDGHRILLDSVDLGLTRYEFRMLRLLLSHPGRVYSREQLLEQVWEHPEETLDRSVDTHIKTLRQKIRAVDAQLDVIRTHRGLGYAYIG